MTAMAETGFKAGGKVAPAIPEGGEPGPIPGFRRLPGPIADHIVGDWGDEDPRYVNATRASVRHNDAQDRIPKFAKIAIGVALGLPVGHFLPPLYWIGVGGAVTLVFGWLYFSVFKRRLESIEAAREAEQHYVDLEPMAKKYGLTGIDAAALHANPGLRPVKTTEGTEILSSMTPEQLRHREVKIDPPKSKSNREVA